MNGKASAAQAAEDAKREAELQAQYVIVPHLICKDSETASASKSALIKDTANSLGLHNTLQYGPRSLAAEVENVCILVTSMFYLFIILSAGSDPR